MAFSRTTVAASTADNAAIGARHRWRRGARLLIGGAVAAAALAFAAPTAGAAPNDNASCVGKLTVFNTEYPEVFGTRADVSHDIQDLAAEEGVSPGSLLSMIAKQSSPLEACA